MSNPVESFAGTVCDQCGETLEKGDDLFLVEGQRFCEDCADENNNICECGQFKKEEYKTCYDCARA